MTRRWVKFKTGLIRKQGFKSSNGRQETEESDGGWGGYAVEKETWKGKGRDGRLFLSPSFYFLTFILSAGHSVTESPIHHALFANEKSPWKKKQKTPMMGSFHFQIYPLSPCEVRVCSIEHMLRGRELTRLGMLTSMAWLWLHWMHRVHVSCSLFFLRAVPSPFLILFISQDPNVQISIVHAQVGRQHRLCIPLTPLFIPPSRSMTKDYGYKGPIPGMVFFPRFLKVSRTSSLSSCLWLCLFLLFGRMHGVLASSKSSEEVGVHVCFVYFASPRFSHPLPSPSRISLSSLGVKRQGHVERRMMNLVVFFLFWLAHTFFPTKKHKQKKNFHAQSIFSFIFCSFCFLPCPHLNLCRGGAPDEGTNRQLKPQQVFTFLSHFYEQWWPSL